MISMAASAGKMDLNAIASTLDSDHSLKILEQKVFVVFTDPDCVIEEMGCDLSTVHP
jgi:hypothetical protein